MSVLPQPSFEKLTQREFLAALHRGRRDFTGITFTDRVNLNQFTSRFADITIDSLDLSDCDLGPDFNLGDLTADTLWLERSTSDGKVCLFRPTIRNFHAKQLQVREWFAVVNGNINGCDLSFGHFPGGFIIKKTSVSTLILDNCRSTQTVIDETDNLIKHCTDIGATLGRRTPTALSELF